MKLKAKFTLIVSIFVNKIIYVSENCVKFCGYTEEELYASPELLEAMIHPKWRTCLKAVPGLSSFLLWRIHD